MVLRENATGTWSEGSEKEQAALTRRPGVVVPAGGKGNVLTKDMVKPGAVVIDVGMNRDEAGKLCGDVDFEGVRAVAGWITPVPGGVGPMTRPMLRAHPLETAGRHRACAPLTRVGRRDGLPPYAACRPGSKTG